MFSKLFLLLAALAPLAPMTNAAPLLNTLPGTLSSTLASQSDLGLFANAFVGATTGGAFQTCDAITGRLGLNVNLGLKLDANLVTKLNTWAAGQCWTNYREFLQLSKLIERQQVAVWRDLRIPVSYVLRLSTRMGRG